jgi:pimeloyl-ACP methyl ester carboxylesterase
VPFCGLPSRGKVLTFPEHDRFHRTGSCTDDRAGNKRIQLDLQANYHSNLARYPEWHAYFAKYQPPALVVWGKGDPLFTVEGAKAYSKDLKQIETHLLETGHFAHEEEHATIAEHTKRFFRANGIH